jgi:hypothetical protein
MANISSSSCTVKGRSRDYRQVILDEKFFPTIDDEVDEPSIQVWNGRQATLPDGSRTCLGGKLLTAMRQMVLAGQFGNVRLPSPHWKRKERRADGLSNKESDAVNEQLMAWAKLPQLVPNLPSLAELEPTLYEHLRGVGFAPHCAHEVMKGLSLLDSEPKEHYQKYLFNVRFRDNKVEVEPILRRNLTHYITYRQAADSTPSVLLLDLGRLAFELQVAGDTSEHAASTVRFGMWLDRCPK